VPDRADLEHHHAHSVRDDVVQLARDPRSLLCHRDACRCFALPFRLDRTDFRGLGLLCAFAQSKAGGPADPEVDGDEDEFGRQVAGDVVDDGRDAPEDDRQSGPRPPAVAHIPEQESGRHPDGEEADHERDQQPVDERERRGEEPVSRRSGEGKAPACEERKHDCRHCGYGEPQRRGRRARRVSSDDELEHGCDGQNTDQQLEPVLAPDGSDPAHALNVSHCSPRRLLPE
jgi:hypothetical protein